MSELQTFNCECGFSWLQGRDGSHYCAEYYRVKVADLLREKLELQLTLDNIVAALGITGDSPVSKLVIERVLKAEASSVELNAQGCELFAAHCEAMHQDLDRFQYTPASVRWRTAGRAAKEFADNLREGKL